MTTLFYLATNGSFKAASSRTSLLGRLPDPPQRPRQKGRTERLAIDLESLNLLQLLLRDTISRRVGIICKLQIWRILFSCWSILKNVLPMENEMLF